MFTTTSVARPSNWNRNLLQSRSQGIMPTQSQTQSSFKTPLLAGYQTDGFFDELIDEHGAPRLGAEQLVALINSMPGEELLR